jgi:hypothetical protein
MDRMPDVGRSANWWAYYYCSGSTEICRYHVSDYYGLVTTYLRPCPTGNSCSWTSGTGHTYDSWLALLITGNTTLTNKGNLSAYTLSDTVNVTTSGKKTNFGNFEANNPASCSSGAAPNTRFFFISGGLFSYTHYWWSNPESWTLAKQGTASTIQQEVNEPGDWSDWNGHAGNYNSQTEARFANAIKHVRWVGLSFGGGCFFENGVDVTGPKRAIFNSTFTETP